MNASVVSVTPYVEKEKFKIVVLVLAATIMLLLVGAKGCTDDKERPTFSAASYGTCA